MLVQRVWKSAFIVLAANCCVAGTLAPSLVETEPNTSSIDIIFATYWFYPAKTKAIMPDDQRCIDDMMDRQDQRFDFHSESIFMPVARRGRSTKGHGTPI